MNNIRFFHILLLFKNTLWHFFKSLLPKWLGKIRLCFSDFDLYKRKRSADREKSKFREEKNLHFLNCTTVLPKEATLSHITSRKWSAVTSVVNIIILLALKKDNARIRWVRWIRSTKHYLCKVTLFALDKFLFSVNLLRVWMILDFDKW
jgi:hypothetical protein